MSFFKIEARLLLYVHEQFAMSMHLYIYIYIIYFCYLVNPKTLSKKVQEAKSILKIQRKCERIT